MGKSLLVSVIAGCCALAAGCASAPISIATGNAVPLTSAQTETQQSLRGASNRLQSVFEERGWIRNANAMQETTRSWMARLTGQDAGDDAPAEAQSVPYLADTNFASMDSAVAVARLSTDLDEAHDLVRDVDLAAARLVAGGEGVTRASLTRDLELVERAMAHSREALDTFDQAIETVAGNAESSAQTAPMYQLLAHREELSRQSEHLRDRADEIAAIRRNLTTDAAS